VNETFRFLDCLSLYDELKQRFGAPGEFAQAYVLAHELWRAEIDWGGRESPQRAGTESASGRSTFREAGIPGRTGLRVSGDTATDQPAVTEQQSINEAAMALAALWKH